MTLFWHPIEIELALSERMRRADEAQEREKRGEWIGSELPFPMVHRRPAPPPPRPERVLLEWVEPVPLGAAVAYLLTMDMGREGE
jgi:hypothetical protein